MDVIHHEPWTEKSYRWCHWRAAGVARGLLLCLSDGGELAAADRRTETADM